jgi:hypothetical protein
MVLVFKMIRRPRGFSSASRTIVICNFRRI